MDKKISVIGGSGFIGTALCKNLALKQMDFEIIDLKVSQGFPQKSKIGDIRNIDELRSCITGNIVVNLAAVHRDDITDNNAYYTTNVAGSENIAQVCAEKKIDKIIFTSSVAVYGFASCKTDEEGQIDPFNDYGRTKALAENIFDAWFQKNKACRSLLIIRPTVVFGTGNRGNIYNLFDHINSSRFAMIGSGKNKKSMAYVENVAAFLMQCIETNRKQAVFNYVDEPDMTMNELVSYVRTKLKGKTSVGLRFPKWLGLLAGYVADSLAPFGLKLPISSIRVRKFCASSEFSTAKADLDGFVAPFTLQEALDKTLTSEFINPKADQNHSYTE